MRPPQKTYPEHEKLRAAKVQKAQILAFLDHLAKPAKDGSIPGLRTEARMLCGRAYTGGGGEEWQPLFLEILPSEDTRLGELLDAYFNVDRNLLEQERRDMLAEAAQ